MNLSASRIGLIFECPRKYKLSYVDYLEPLEKKEALTLGSGVHWGIENETSDLTEYYGKVEYTLSQLLAESMVNCFLRERDYIMKKILDGVKGEVVEFKEFELDTKLPSKLFKPHNLVGIVDLLIVTEEGIIIIDYKTSSQKPNYDDYLPQIYTYKYLVESKLKLPVLKMGIINLRKAGIRQTQKETIDEFKIRLKQEYILNSEAYLDTYIFTKDDVNQEKYEAFIENLTDQGDYLQSAVELKLFPMNLAACNNWGGCEFKPICFGLPGAMNLFKKKY